MTEDRWVPPVLQDPSWQMTTGERAALEGLLSFLSPTLSIEIGTAEGGSLRRIAAHSDEVHSIDLDHSRLGEPAQNVHLHEGNSRELLPRLLEDFASAERQVDFVLVDGDHTSEGVAADVSALLESPATSRSAVLLHDTMNPDVRSGIETAISRVDRSRQLALDLDLVPGMLALEPPFEGELWGGLGLLVVGDTIRVFERADAFQLLSAELESRHQIEATPEAPALVAERERYRAWLREVKSSPSWRLTSPLRALKQRLSRGGKR